MLGVLGDAVFAVGGESYVKLVLLVCCVHSFVFMALLFISVPTFTVDTEGLLRNTYAYYDCITIAQARITSAETQRARTATP